MNARWKLLGAGVLLAFVVALVLWLQYAPVDPLPESPPPPPVAAAPPASAPTTRPGRPAVPPPPPQPVTQPPPDGPSGLALFPPPGTKPIKRGIVVPEGFELPPGYVRHYQTTDDGQRLPAILMFHPDFKPTGPNGQPIPIPPDRLVPPELAPKGMPVQVLTLPDEKGDPD
ncbi:MAG TPA: hypothetical protein VFA20_30955 [Myxococcaceae bacterium]|nr:hypothetical protein [Myxococcaceae bacterium]